MAKLTMTQVRAAYKRLAAGEEYQKVAADLGVEPDTLRAITSGRSWTHLKLAPLPPRTGETKPGSKLTAEDIPIICRRIQQGDSISQVARDYGVGRTCISNIWHGRTWKHVTRPAVRVRVWER